MTITIEEFNYFPGKTYSDDFNAKVLYRKNGKLYLAHVYVDFFNEHVHISLNQPKECKVLNGFIDVVNEYAKKEFKFKN